MRQGPYNIILTKYKHILTIHKAKKADKITHQSTLIYVICGVRHRLPGEKGGAPATLEHNNKI